MKVKHKKRKKKKVNLNHSLLQSKVNNQLFPPPSNIKPSNINSYSWFDINNKPIKNNNDINHLSIDPRNSVITSDASLFKGQLFQIFPDHLQKYILDHWLESYRLMINATVKVFKTNSFIKNNLYPDFKNIRTNYLKYDKNIIYNNSSPFSNSDKFKIYSHSLDYAIKDVCTNLKSALTNLSNGHIRSFRLRYTKKNKKTKILKIEKRDLKINGTKLKNPILGDIDCKIELPEITSDCTFLYKNNRYFIIVPQKLVVNKTKKLKIENTIGLDGGIRTFMTGYNPKETIQIGNNMNERLIKIYKQIDRIQSKIDSGEIKNKRGLEKRRRKIRNIIDDLHWKSINYLTDRYDNILLGNISTKSIVSNKKTLGKYTKRVAMSMRLFVYKERLKYKSNLKGKRFIIVNESYTSKICSSCAEINMEENKSKIFRCHKCGCKMDRDYNGARNIYKLGIIE